MKMLNCDRIVFFGESAPHTICSLSDITQVAATVGGVTKVERCFGVSVVIRRRAEPFFLPPPFLVGAKLGPKRGGTNKVFVCFIRARMSSKGIRKKELLLLSSIFFNNYLCLVEFPHIDTSVKSSG